MRIDVGMQIGSNAESVTITADASLLKTENSAVAQNVTVSQMNNLPILSSGRRGQQMPVPVSAIRSRWRR